MAHTAFHADPSAVAELVATFNAADSADNAVQRQVLQQLDSFSSIPEYPEYLCYIFTQSKQESPAVRQRAGLAFKNAILGRLGAFPPSVLQYIKNAIWDGLDDGNAAVRSTTASVLDHLIRTIGPSEWPESIIKLMQVMQTSPSLPARETAYKTIANICRQAPRSTAALEINGQRPFDTIIPDLIHRGLTARDSASIRVSSLQALSAFIVVQPPIFTQHLQRFLSNLFGLTSDPSIAVRKAVVEAMNLFLRFWTDAIVPHIEPVIDFMLYCMQSKDEEEELALTAAEFLLTFTDEPDLYEPLHIHLEKFLPGLLQAMTFSSNSRAVLDLDEDDHAKVDNASDIKPHIYKDRTTGSAKVVPSLAARMGMTADDLNGANGDDAGEDDDAAVADDDEDEDDEGEWTTRTAAATALETAAESFEGALLDILLPQLTQMLSQGNWYQKEAAIFALGNVAGGCIESMYEHLPSLLPFLLQSLEDEHPLVRSSAAWTIGEYSSWIAASGQEFLLPAIQGLLNVALDNNKHAQGDAITAFGYLAKEAGPTGALQPYLPSIAQAVGAAFSKYQYKNIIKLYDAIAHLSDGVGAGGLADEQVLQTVMHPLIKRWQALSDDDPDLRYLLECLTSLVVAAGAGFGPYAEPVLERAYRIVHASLYQYQQHQDNPSANEAPDKAFLVVALDLISGLVQALGSDAEGALAPFVQTSDAGTLPILLVLLSYPEAAVRQSAFALIGDIAANAIPALYPLLDQLLPLLTKAINPQPRAETAGMDSNCAWCIGELALALGGSIAPFVPGMLEQLVPVFGNIKASAHYMENAAICVGRLALAAPEQVAPHFAEIVGPWAQTMVHASKGFESDTALQGMCAAAKANPAALESRGTWLAQALATCENPSAELQSATAEIARYLR